MGIQPKTHLRVSYCHQEQAPDSSPHLQPLASGTAAAGTAREPDWQKTPITSLSRKGGRKRKRTSTAQRQNQCCCARRLSTCSQQTSRQGQGLLTRRSRGGQGCSIPTKSSVSLEDKTQTPDDFHLSVGNQGACCHKLQGPPYR